MGIDLAKDLEGVRYEVRDHIATVTLDRPERGNSLAPPMQAMFRAIWADVRDNPDVRVAILGSSGERHYCTGFDVSEAEGDDADAVFNNRPLAESVHWSPHQNRVMKPVICIVNGLCVGGGLHFVVDSDIVLASPDGFGYICWVLGEMRDGAEELRHSIAAQYPRAGTSSPFFC